MYIDIGGNLLNTIDMDEHALYLYGMVLYQLKPHDWSIGMYLSFLRKPLHLPLHLLDVWGNVPRIFKLGLIYEIACIAEAWICALNSIDLRALKFMQC